MIAMHHSTPEWAAVARLIERGLVEEVRDDE